MTMLLDIAPEIGTAGIAAVVGFFLVFAAAVLSPAIINGVATDRTSGEMWLLSGIVYFVSTLIATFFNAAIVAAASDRMAGGTRGKRRSGPPSALARRTEGFTSARHRSS